MPKKDRMNVAGSIAMISDKFDIEQKISQYKKELKLKSKKEHFQPIQYSKPSQRGSPIKQELEAIIEDKAPESEFLKAIELFNTESKQVKDLTSVALGKNKNIKTKKEDIEEDKLFQKFKKGLQELYPDGNIPKDKIDGFHKRLKLDRFRESLKNELFFVIFRDKEFMSALDESIKAKKHDQKHK